MQIISNDGYMYETIAEAVQYFLGHPAFTGCHAAMTATEIAGTMPTQIGYEGLTIQAPVVSGPLRKFRQAVLQVFFNAHPYAAFIRDYEELRAVIERYTSVPESEIEGWRPNRSDLVLAIQGKQLFNKSTTHNHAYYYPDSGRICCYKRVGGMLGWSQVNPQDYNAWDFDNIWDGWKGVAGPQLQILQAA